MTATEHEFSQPDCLLTLAVPIALEDEVLDTLRALPDLAPGFTLTRAEGLGAHIALDSAMEQVQGRARRVVVQMAVHQAHLPPLLAALRQALPTPQVAYWAVPLLTFGRLGSLA
jgi:hypothetical protein